MVRLKHRPSSPFQHRLFKITDKTPDIDILPAAMNINSIFLSFTFSTQFRQETYTYSQNVNTVEPVEKLILFRLIKNAQMQGARNPEE
jgi:hypothetical protein